MSEEMKQYGNALPKKKLTADELVACQDLDSLTNEELDRRTAIIRAKKEEADLQDIKDRLDERKNERDMHRNEFESRGRELTKTVRDNEIVQKNCAHKKGGRGQVPGGLLRGNDVNHCLIKHILPTGEMWCRCSRCGKTFRPTQRNMFPQGPEGDAAFEKSKAEYAWAVDANTDNQTSSSITFQWVSDDNNVTAKKFVQEAMKDVNLR